MFTKRRLTGLTVLIALGSLHVGCSNDASAPASESTTQSPAATSESAASEGGVDWDNYSPTVKSRIDSLALAKECEELQSEFDTAAANDSAQRNRTGSGNADLMQYINEKLKSAGCQ